MSDAEAKQKVIDDALLEQQKTQQQTGVTKEVSKQLGEEIYGPGKGTDEFGNIINIKKVSDFKKDLIKSGKNLYGLESAAPKGTQSIVNTATGEGMSLMPGAEIPAGFELTGVSGGSKLSTGLAKAGSGLKAFGTKTAGTAMGKAGTWMTKGVTGGSSTLAQLANPAMFATLAGEGIKRLSDDKDPTTWNVGEASGSVLSGVGTGAGIGSMILPGIGTAAGAIIGGGIAAARGLISRKKARREEARLEKERQKEIDEYNEELAEDFGMRQSAVRAGNIRQKTYSGYDLGRNVVAQLGGMRMGVPRYAV